MTCHTSSFAKIEAGTTIKSNAHPDEIIFYVGADEALVMVFDQESLGEFLAVGQKTLLQVRDKSRKVVGSRGGIG